jgi:hypothetical protein
MDTSTLTIRSPRVQARIAARNCIIYRAKVSIALIGESKDAILIPNRDGIASRERLRDSHDFETARGGVFDRGLQQSGCATEATGRSGHVMYREDQPAALTLGALEKPA